MHIRICTYLSQDRVEALTMRLEMSLQAHSIRGVSFPSGGYVRSFGNPRVRAVASATLARPDTVRAAPLPREGRCEGGSGGPGGTTIETEPRTQIRLDRVGKPIGEQADRLDDGIPRIDGCEVARLGTALIMHIVQMKESMQTHDEPACAPRWETLPD